jgi:hypothetical protein
MIFVVLMNAPEKREKRKTAKQKSEEKRCLININS